MTPFEKPTFKQEIVGKKSEKPITEIFDQKETIFRETAEFHEPGSEKEGEKIREIIFREIAFSKILLDFINDLKKVGLEEKVVNEFVSLVKKQKNRDVVDAVLATPIENRLKVIRVVIEENVENKPEIKNNPTAFAEAIFWGIAEISQELGRYLGYHTSNQEISKKNLAGGGSLFNIIGTEMDERDQDIPMAFYAATYKNLYREKNPRYLYLVSGLREYRIDDRVRNWMRAPKLAGVGGPYLIDEIDLDIEKYYKSIIDKNKER